MAADLVAVLAVAVAAQYGFIGLYIVPRLARLAAEPRVTVVRTAQWAATLFFLGCATTHVLIAIHALTEPGPVSGHLLTARVWPHVAQVVGGALFTLIAWRKIEVRFAPKGYEADRRREARERERAARLLAQRAAEQEAVSELGQLALRTGDPSELHHEAARVLTEILDVDSCSVLELAPSGQELRMIAGVGWNPGIVGELRVPAGDKSLGGLALQRRTPVVVADLRRETALPRHSCLVEHGIVGSMTVVIGGHKRPFGVLGVHTRTPRDFSDHDIHVLQSVAHVLAAAIERATAERESHHRSLHDPLTQLPNRALFLDRLEHALARGARRPQTVAVLFMDLDNFKGVNDTFGHPAGDELLARVAARLQTVVRPTETLARFGGDEFALLCDELDSAHDATAIGRRLAEALGNPFPVGGQDHFLSASIGIALACSPDVEAEDLLRDADVAMYRAKDDGRGRIELFGEALRDSVRERVRTENALRGAVDRGEMHVVYQPKVSMSDGSILGMEALLRWEDPDRGSVSPGEFIPLAEQTGLIVPIGTWVLTQACRQAAAWRAAHPGIPLKVAVNVSAHQLAQPDFPAILANALAHTGARPEDLAIEITESLLMQMGGSPQSTLEELRRCGVEIHLDDFGTGYSSLGYVESLPLDALKMDRTFLAGLAERQSSRAIFSAVVTMADALELAVIAEGVETAEQAERLRSLGCGQAQGYYFGRPMSSEDVDELLHSTAPSAGQAAALPGD